MEAPVPASALIHSATLVSAGIYLILRFKGVLLLSEYATVMLPLVGAFTACLGAISAAYQTDIKRLLAYSTISHCGFLVVCAILCDAEYTIFYLYVHGFFKAASFICVGNIIRFNCGGQDIRHMGGYAKYLPFECLALGICLLFLAGAPFSFGFFTKHYLLASIASAGVVNRIIMTLLLMSACLGAVYCARLYYGVFYGIKRSNKFVYNNVARHVYYNFDTHGTFYTNSTIGSSFAICGLIFFGMYICWVFGLYMSQKTFNTANFGTIIIKMTIYSLKQYLTLSAMFNYGLLNLLMVFIILFICSVSFVWIYKAEQHYELLGALLFLVNVIIMIAFFTGII
jgi:NADH:ubiquinone oxidoreductase subunit 5 (subunit L)/multisubunit Na+/H+ antiporter MnhA subunit